jgi:hypothetical protein
MLRVRLVPLVIAAIAGSAPFVSAAPMAQGALTLQQPAVPKEVYRVDLATGSLIPLESTKARKQGSGTLYCYLEGAHSPVTIRQGEALAFAARLDGSPKYLENVGKYRTGPYQLEFLFISDEDRRYATKKFVPMGGGAQGEVVFGVNPRKPKDAGQTFTFKPLVELGPGDYAFSEYGLLVGTYPYPGCAKEVWAFRIVEGPPPVQRAAPPPPGNPPPPLPAPVRPGPAKPAPAAPRNSPTEIERLRRAAEQGDVAAQLNLAKAYATGNGIPQDYEQTSQWFRKAADQGSAEAQYWLGVMFRDAVGVGADQGQAAQFFGRAAELGYAQAQANLGNLHFTGRGVLQDYVEAHKWLNIAGTGLEGDERNQCVELRDKVAGLMTPAQLAEAQRRAADWIEAFRKRKP